MIFSNKALVKIQIIVIVVLIIVVISGIAGSIYYFIAKIATPTFSPAGGTYSSSQNITLDCSTTGATIRFTLDGSEPTSSSAVYNDSISIIEKTTIKAKAFKTNLIDSDTASATYIIKITVDLATAASSGLVQASISGISSYSMQKIIMTVTSKSNYELDLTIQPSTIFKANSGTAQNMVSLSKIEINLEPGENRSLYIDTACASMNLDVPGSSDQFTISQSSANEDLSKLINLQDFKNATFRVQQFGIWTITDNPTRDEYRGISSTYFTYSFSGPTDTEMQDIKSLFVRAGIPTQNYQALT